MRLDDLNLADLDRFAGGFPHEMFTLLRREAPVWWHPPTLLAPGGEGFWVISRHAETLAVLRDPATFSSEAGGGRAGGGTTLDDLPVAALGLLNMMDPPRHTRIRLLVNKGMKPRTLAELEPALRQRARAILDAVAERGACDFLREVAAELPLQAIAGLLGVPQEDRHQLFEWTTAIVDYRDRDLGGTSHSLEAAIAGLRRYGEALVARTREAPGDDMLSLVVHAGIEGADGRREKLADAEVLSFFHLLLVAGSETTRNAIAHGLLALLQHPEQLRVLREHPAALPGAVEEILRWTSPTSYNRRTATRDVELAGQKIRAGDKLTHWYPSANRDERVFAEPFRFDVRRAPNPHLAFGSGEHHCLGASLARAEMRLLFEELLARFERVELAGEVEWARSNKHNGMRRLPVRLEGRRRP
jgi:cytochrome P450